MITRLKEVLGRPNSRLGLVSGYFVPTAATVRTIDELAAHRVAVSVVTNAFEATDVRVVHAGYAEDRTAAQGRRPAVGDQGRAGGASSQR